MRQKLTLFYKRKDWSPATLFIKAKIYPIEDKQNEHRPGVSKPRVLVLLPGHVANLWAWFSRPLVLGKNDASSLEHKNQHWRPAGQSQNVSLLTISPISFFPQCWGTSSSLARQHKTFWGLNSSPEISWLVHNVWPSPTPWFHRGILQGHLSKVVHVHHVLETHK